MTEPHERAILSATEAILEDHASNTTRIAARRRRFRRALNDLGLGTILGPDWCQIGDDGFEFAPITARQADKLTNAIENLAQRQPLHRTPRPCPGQGSFGF